MVENARQTTVVHFIADGEVKEFSFNFQIFEAGDVDVYLDETLTDTGYNVSIDENIGGKVIFSQPPVNGTRITIIRNLDIKRTSDFQEGGAFRAKVINHELDYQVATLQQLDEKIGRSMIYPPYVQDGVSMQLPLPSAGKALIWNQQATALENSSAVVDDLQNVMQQYRDAAKQAQIAAENSKNEAAQAALASADSAGQAKTFAQLAQDWANKLGDTVDGIEYSAKKYAQEAKSYARQANIASIQSNCITAIPQDINLELNNGTLTLKAGSKVYVPNGVGVFDEYVVESDISRDAWSSITGSYLVLLQPTDSGYAFGFSNNATSGTTPPQSGVFFNTETNIISIYSGGSISTQGWSLPLCVGTFSNGVITSIDQVFNGFGYIGSTIFALPGVEGLIPNGRNADGSLNNTKFVTTSILSKTYPINVKTGTVFLTSISIGAVPEWYYDSDKNIITDGSDVYKYVEAGYCIVDSTGRVTSFKPKQVFRAVDVNDLDDVKYAVESGNNYIYFPDKTLIQWGQAGAGSSVNVTLPKPFVNTSYSVTALSTNDGGTSNPYRISVYNRTATNFNLVCTAATIGKDWIAIGKGA